MKNIFPGHFRPTEKELENYWKNAIFVFDANVLLNLYRYSSTTRKELQNAISLLGERAHITHQAANEFLKNRLSVTSDQAKEYEAGSKTIKQLVEKISCKDRHPFIDDDILSELKNLSAKVLENLEKHKKILLDKLSKDEILDFVEKTFYKKTGKAYDTDKLSEISTLGQSTL